MEFHHSCSFCGWRRSSATPVMLSPSCERCGCALDAAAAPAGGSHADVQAWVMPAAARLAARSTGALLCVLMLYAAAKLGYDAAGAAGGMIAFGAGGFLLLPFVPEQVG